MKIARVQLSPEYLRQALSLPPGTKIVWAGMGGHHVIELTIEHPDLRDVELGDLGRPPLITPTMQREGDAVLLVDWGQTS